MLLNIQSNHLPSTINEAFFTVSGSIGHLKKLEVEKGSSLQFSWGFWPILPKQLYLLSGSQRILMRDSSFSIIHLKCKAELSFYITNG